MKFLSNATKSIIDNRCEAYGFLILKPEIMEAICKGDGEEATNIFLELTREERKEFEDVIGVQVEGGMLIDVTASYFREGMLGMLKAIYRYSKGSPIKSLITAFHPYAKKAMRKKGEEVRELALQAAMTPAERKAIGL